MDVCAWSGSISALALLLARSMSTEELAKLSLLLTQLLGTQLATLAALEQMEQGSTASQTSETETLL